MSNKKKFLVHLSQHNKPLYTMSFASRTELASYLRRQGLKFRNETISNINQGFVCFEDKIGFKYEIEEQIEQQRTLIFEHGLYIPLRDYAEETGQSKRAVLYAFKHNRIKGLSVGKKNLVYIYKGDFV